MYTPARAVDEEASEKKVRRKDDDERKRDRRLLRKIANLVEDAKCRLLTLTGAGGIGKTRLALATASQLQDSFEFGGIFINLAPLVGRDQIVTAIADALGIVLYSASDRSVQLINRLQDKEVFIVLDNFEHLLNAVLHVKLPNCWPNILLSRLIKFLCF